MAKNRFINTKIWNDSWVIELDPIEKLLFLYLLTNEHTNIAGIYELPLRLMAFETGIDKEMILKVFNRFETANKIHYINNWVYIVNFVKHQYARGSSKVKIGIENAKKEVPKSILDKIAKISPDTIPLIRDTKGVSALDSDSDSDLDLDLDSITPKGDTDEINQIFDIFYNSVNPTINYGNKTSRLAVKELLDKYPLDDLKRITEYACSVQGKPYTPVITTPYQLKEKLGALKIYKDKENINKPIII